MGDVEDLKLSIFTGRCKVEGCLGFVKSKGLCDMHYKRLRRKGSLANVRPRHYGPCKIEGCGQPPYAKGLCTKHYHQARMRGLLELRDAQNGFK